MGICFLVTDVCSVAAGVRAVVADQPNSIQFVIKMSAVIILAVYAGGLPAACSAVAAHFGAGSAGARCSRRTTAGTGIEVMRT